MDINRLTKVKNKRLSIIRNNLISACLKHVIMPQITYIFRQIEENTQLATVSDASPLDAGIQLFAQYRTIEQDGYLSQNVLKYIITAITTIAHNNTESENNSLNLIKQNLEDLLENYYGVHNMLSFLSKEVTSLEELYSVIPFILDEEEIGLTELFIYNKASLFYQPFDVFLRTNKENIQIFRNLVVDNLVVI